MVPEAAGDFIVGFLVGDVGKDVGLREVEEGDMVVGFLVVGLFEGDVGNNVGDTVANVGVFVPGLFVGEVGIAVGCFTGDLVVGFLDGLVVGT